MRFKFSIIIFSLNTFSLSRAYSDLDFDFSDNFNLRKAGSDLDFEFADNLDHMLKPTKLRMMKPIKFQDFDDEQAFLPHYDLSLIHI